MDVKRARDHGVIVGRFEPEALDAVTDVPGVLAGHATVVRDDTPGAEGSKPVRTGVTTLWPHDAERWRDRVHAGTSISNGYGELSGVKPANATEP